MKEEIVYLALYNPMIHESSHGTLSVHRTRKGAEMAIAFHKEEQKKEWDELYAKEDEGVFHSKFGHFEDWCVRKVKLED